MDGPLNTWICWYTHTETLFKTAFQEDLKETLPSVSLNDSENVNDFFITQLLVWGGYPSGTTPPPHAGGSREVDLEVLLSPTVCFCIRRSLRVGYLKTALS